MVKNNLNCTVSIILPVRNEQKYIKDTINSILNQCYDKAKLQIIVVDGNSTDKTKSILKYFESHINVLDNPRHYMPVGFNIGLNEAKGDIIIMMGGHCLLDKHYVKNCVGLLSTDKYSCVGGLVKNIGTNNKQHVISIALSSYFGVGGVNFRMQNADAKYVDTVAFGAYKRKVFKEIGALDEELKRNQDDEFNFRLLKSGYKIWLDPSIISYYRPRGSLRKLFLQYFKYGFYKIRVMQKRKGIPAWRHLIPGFFVISLVTTLIIGALTNIYLLFFVVTSSYLSINLFFSIWESRQRFNIIYLLPLIFLILHFSYGVGFICGMIYFWNKYKDCKVRDYHFNSKQF